MAQEANDQDVVVDSEFDETNPTESDTKDDEGGQDNKSSKNAIDETVENELSSGNSDLSLPEMEMPDALPDGRLLVPIGLYQSQMDELVPEDYRPISLRQMKEAIVRWTDRATGDQASRLKSSVYWVEIVGDMLVSDRSVIDIQSDRRVEVRRSLGKVNLAIEQSRGFQPTMSGLPRLESEADGNLVAVFRGDDSTRAGIEFRWRLRGKVSGRGHQFTMNLPRTPQTRIVFSAPPGISLRTEQGVLRSRPGPPSDASEIEKSRDLRWYELDAGGLSSITIHTLPEDVNGAEDRFVVRRSVIQYDADPGGLNWTSRMVVQFASGNQFPVLVVGGTTVTSVQVNSTEIPFSSDVIGGRARHLKFDLPSEILEGVTSTLDITIMGHTTWSDRNGWCDLPMPVWSGEGVVHASTVDDALLSVTKPLQVMTWELPAKWKHAEQKELDSGVTLLVADGPPIALAVGASSGNKTIGRTWSRVRFIERPTMDTFSTALRLNVAAGSLSAQARIAIELDSNRVEPIQIRVEPNWTVDAITFISSGRVLENPKVNETGVIVLWPENEDVINSRIVIEARGSRGISGGPARLSVPPTWFVRPARVRGDLVAAVVPPDDLNWSGDAAMQRDRVELASLDESQQAFFAGVGPETLWFKPSAGRTPQVTLQTPSVSFSASTLFDVRRIGDEVEENLWVEVQSEGQSLKELIVQTGTSDVRGAFVWSISGGGDATTIGLPSSDVTESDGVYTIDVSDRSLRDKKLMARRRYPVQPSLEVQLPSVPGAASQTSDAVIGSGLVVTQKSSAVQLVPAFVVIDDSSPKSSASDDLVTRNELNGTSVAQPAVNFDAGETATRETIRLRYDAVQQPMVTLARSDVNPNVTIVWREQVRVEASSRGTDRIEALYEVSPTAPFAITYGPELQLEAITRDGESVDLMSVLQQPLILQPRSKTERIRVVWNRRQFGSRWSRSCRIPEIGVSGTVLKSEYQLIAASDTFVPAALLRGDQAIVGSATVIDMQPGESATLVRRNVALAIGWLFALLVFSACWFISDRSPYAVAGLVTLFTVILVLWWPWRLAVIGWLIMPSVAAATLATSRAWEAKKRPLKGRGDSADPSSLNELPGDFSVDSTAKLMALCISVTLFLSAFVAAQDLSPTGDKGPDPFADNVVNVLVPMNEVGKISSDIVYIPKAVHAQLFRTTNGNEPQDTRIQSASYRVMLDPALVELGRTNGVVIEADYVVHLEDGDRNLNVVRLPLEAASVRRLELVDDINQIKRFGSDPKGRLVATLPPGSTFRLRATLIPGITLSAPWTNISLTIPPIASSRLTVESDQNLDGLRVDGRLLEETDLRRWTEQLGPTSSLEIEFRTLANAKTEASNELQRRYWIHAGKSHVTIDCEVDPPSSIAEGETFQFVIRDAGFPHLTSPSWRLDRSDEYSPTRRLMTMTCIEDNPGPIRLLWTQPVSFASDESVNAESIRIPEVIAAALGDNAPAWIALHCDSDLQFDALDRDSTESLSVDHFLAAWTGYRGRIERASVALRDFPNLVLRRRRSTTASVTQRHHLHALSDRLELSYSGRLTPSDSSLERYALRVPRAMELVHLTVNGQTLSHRPRAAGDVNVILLGSFSGDEEVTIEAVAVQRLTSSLRFSSPQFSPPRMTVSPQIETSDQYTISRDRSTSLKALEPPLKDVISAQKTVTADSLAEGWVPVATWLVPSETGLRSNSIGGLYEVRDRQTRFDCRQLIILDRVDDQWNMETLIRFNNKAKNRFPDFVDVEIPTRWCESLQVGPSTVWSRQPATDPSRQIIRIRCSPDELTGRTIWIRGRLQSTETARVSVPSVRVLGLGQRQIHLSLPSRLAAEPVQWRTAAVEAVSAPPLWRDNIVSKDRAVYLVANQSWSIDLAPLPEIEVEPVAVHQDVQVFTQSDGVLVMSHWDLFPGGLESVLVRLPEGASPLGAWSAGQAVVAELLEMGDAEDAQGRWLRIPLTLSRLSQPLEVLMRVPSSSAKQAEYIPVLDQVPVTQRWLTNYGPTPLGTASERGMSAQTLERGLAQARSVVEAVESLDMVAQRPRDEIAAWLRLWMTRYQMIADASDHRVEFESNVDSTDTMRADPFNLEFAQGLTIEEEAQWQELDSRLSVFNQRFLRGDSDRLVEAAEPFLFGVNGFAGFYPQRMARLSAVSLARPVQPASSSDRGLRNMIVNGLTLMVVGGCLICLGPFRQYLVPVFTHPAFWLALVGVFGFAVAPVPVAGAILLVAVALPVFPAKRPPVGNERR